MAYITSYQEYRKLRPMTGRERLRYCALEILSRLPKKNTNNNKNEPSVVFLAYHFLFEDNVLLFREFIEVLANEYNFLSITEAVNGLNTNTLSGRNICFTCDDGFMSCKQAGDILSEYGASCCFFLCPSFIENRDYDTVVSVNKKRLGGPPIEFLNWTDVDDLLALGHEIGNHTFSHKNLGLVSAEVMEDEITRAHNTLVAKYGSIKHFACPYGHPNAYTKQAVELIKHLSYDSFSTTTRGKHTCAENSNEFLIKRQHFEPFWPVKQSLYFFN